MNKIKGSTKMWSIIGIVFTLFSNWYVKPWIAVQNAPPESVWMFSWILITIIVNILVFFALLFYFFTYILPNINNWADDTF